MASHKAECIICGEETWCHDEEHVLGIGDGCCGDPSGVMEFCSVKCFVELKERWEQRKSIILATPDEWPRVTQELNQALTLPSPE